MKIVPVITITIVILAMVVLGVWLSNNPIRAAKAKCKRHLEVLTGHDLSVQDDFSMHVTGDVNSGKVQVAFLRAGELRTAECLLEWGEVRRLKLDGKEIPGR